MEVNFDSLSDKEKVSVVSVLIVFRDSVRDDIEKIEDSKNILKDINLILEKVIVGGGNLDEV